MVKKIVLKKSWPETFFGKKESGQKHLEEKIWVKKSMVKEEIIHTQKIWYGKP